LLAGVEILLFDIFPDHHRYNENELEKIKKGFISSRADYLITTEKDVVRLQNDPEFLKMLTVLRMDMEIITFHSVI